MVGSDRLNVPAIDTSSQQSELLHGVINSVSPSCLGCCTIFVHCKCNTVGVCSAVAEY